MKWKYSVVNCKISIFITTLAFALFSCLHYAESVSVAFAMDSLSFGINKMLLSGEMYLKINIITVFEEKIVIILKQFV